MHFSALGMGSNFSITNMFCGLHKISDRLASNHGSPFSLVDLLRFLDD